MNAQASRRTIAPPPRQPARATRRKRAMPGETKRDKFLRIGQYRVTNALLSIRLVGNLADTKTYEWKPEDAVLMVTAMQEALDMVSTRFTRANKPERPEATFRLDMPSSVTAGARVGD